MVELDAAVAAGSAPDIYELLGVQPDAGRLLAREMYWAKMQPLLDSTRRDDPATRAEIEALNDALVILLDDALRARYDAARPTETTPRAVTANGPSAARDASQRSGPGMAIVTLLALIGAVAAAAIAGPWWALAAVPPAVLALAVIATRERGRRREPGALERLGLRAGATADEIDIAYRARAQELLIRLRHDEHAPRELALLDRAYLAAMAEVIAPGAAAQTAARSGRRKRWHPGPGAWRARAHGLRAALVATSGAARPLVAATLAHARLGARSTRTATRDALAAGRDGAREGARGVAAVARSSDRRRATAHAPAPTIDLERRLAASFKASAMELAAGEPAPPSELETPTAWLLLTAAAGVRRVPVHGRPIRIGSSADCDLVLPGRDGVAAEHAMIWRRGDAIILHVTDPQALCRVNNDDVSWASLDDGDALTIGGVTVHVEVATLSD